MHIAFSSTFEFPPAPSTLYSPSSKTTQYSITAHIKIRCPLNTNWRLPYTDLGTLGTLHLLSWLVSGPDVVQEALWMPHVRSLEHSCHCMIKQSNGQMLKKSGKLLTGLKVCHVVHGIWASVWLTEHWYHYIQNSGTMASNSLIANLTTLSAWWYASLPVLISFIYAIPSLWHFQTFTLLIMCWDHQVACTTLQLSRNHIHSKNLNTYLGMVNGSGLTQHMHQVLGVLSLISIHYPMNLQTDNSTIISQGYVK